MPTQQPVTVAVGSHLASALRRLNEELGDSSYRHALRNALVQQVFQHAERLGLTRDERTALLDELREQLASEA